MIQYNPKEWFGLIFRFHKSDTFRKMFWVIFTFSVYVSGVVYIGLKYKELNIFSNAITIHSLLGFVIGLLLVFRTNSAYDRWWEGRKLWGMLVNSSRNCAIKFATLIPEGKTKEKELIATLISNYPIALKEHLRSGVNFEELSYIEGFEKEMLMNQVHIPNAIAQQLFLTLTNYYKKGEISGEQLIVMEKEISHFTDITGGCERIKNTPIPFTYNLFIKKFIFAYTMTLPFGLVNEFHYWSIPISAFILYILGSLELLAEEIEEPFGIDSSDLPTDELAIKIKANIYEIFGQKKGGN